LGSKGSKSMPTSKSEKHVFDIELGVPKCSSVGGSCSSGRLLEGHAKLLALKG
jgi:hypothetical protein